MIKYLFADRDGTLIADKHYLSDPLQVELFPDIAKSLKLLQNYAIKTLVVTNQSGIGRGYFTEQDFLACQKALEQQLRAENVELFDYAFCPHAPEDKCRCRKPALGMWEYLSQKHGINSLECAMIGDKKEDVIFGIKAGFAYSCLVLTGKGQKTACEFSLTSEKAGGAEGELSVFSSEVFGIKQEKTKCYLAPTLLTFSHFLINKNRANL